MSATLVIKAETKELKPITLTSGKKVILSMQNVNLDGFSSEELLEILEVMEVIVPNDIRFDHLRTQISNMIARR